MKKSLVVFVQAFLLFTIVNAQPKKNVGINLTDVIYWETSVPFIDVFKACRPWVDHTSVPPAGTLFDTNGWPTYIPAGKYLSTSIFANANGAYPKGTYVALYEGEGTVVFGGDAKPGTSAPGRVELNVTTTTSTGITVMVSATDPNSNGNYIRNIRILLPGMEGRENEIFNPQFLDNYKDFSTYRFMKWSLAEKLELVTWANRIKPDYFSYGNSAKKAVPVEIMIKLCNRQKTDMWFSMPPLADESYMINCAQLIKDSLMNTSKLHIEYGNETFNYAYPLRKYADSVGTKSSISGQQWIAKKAVRMFAIFDSVFGTQADSRLLKVYTFVYSSQSFTEAQALLAYKPDGTNTLGSLTDEISMASYFGYTATIPSASGGVSDIITNENWTADDIFEWLIGGYAKNKKYTPTDNIDGMRKVYLNFKKEADKYGKKLCLYEFGHHLASWGGSLPILTTTWQDERMYDAYSLTLRDWDTINPGGLIMVFTSASRGAWGLIPTDSVTKPMAYPKYRAILDYINGNTGDLLYHLYTASASGTGLHKQGTTVSVKAATPATGKVFVSWSGDTLYMKNTTDSVNEVTMPAKNIVISATYKNKNALVPGKSIISEVYPNPAADILYVVPPAGAERIELIDATGVILQTVNVRNGGAVAVSVSDLIPGIYFLKAGDGISKFIKE